MPPDVIRLFIGSSTEGRDVARSLQAELESAVEVVRWDQSVFEPGGYTLDSLIATAKAVDFAVLVATPDDKVTSRGTTEETARDNIILEFGIFVGALGRERTYLLSTGKLKLPTDVLGLTRLPYQERSDGNLRAAVSGAALQIEQRVAVLGALQFGAISVEAGPGLALQQEIDLLCSNALAQGWTVRSDSLTTLRLRSPRGSTHTLSKTRPAATREELRVFVRRLRSAGLRVNSALRRPVDSSPFSS